MVSGTERWIMYANKQWKEKMEVIVKYNGLSKEKLVIQPDVQVVPWGLLLQMIWIRALELS